MSKLTSISKQYRITADKLLKQTGLINDLKKFGEVHLTGAYAHNLMIHSDIDLEVVKDKKFSQEEIFALFKRLYLKNKFKSYFLKGKWDDPRLGKEFPDGQYVGMKVYFGGEKWMIDIWLVNKKEANRREQLNRFITEKIDDKKRELILKFKQFRKKNKINIAGYEIYELVLKNNVKSLEEFKRRIKAK
jgi:hypothetical protein